MLERAIDGLRDYEDWEKDYREYVRLRRRLEAGEALLHELERIDYLADRLLRRAHRTLRRNALLLGYPSEAQRRENRF